MESKTLRSWCYLLLTLIVTLSIVLLPFFCRGNYLAWNIKGHDGITQHATFLKYYKETHSVTNIGGFDYKIGLGADYYTSFLYYLILDPFNIFFYVFPFSNFLITYSIIIGLKFITCGIFMFLYLKHLKIRDSIAIIVSSLYMIGGFATFSLPRHPDLSAGVLYLPLMIYGIEIIFENKKPYLLIGSSFVCLISSFYMFYMCSIFVVAYTILYYFEKNNKKQRSVKSFFKQVGKIAFWYLVSILLAGFMLLPMLSNYLTSARSESKGLTSYTLEYYLKLIKATFIPTFIMEHYTPYTIMIFMIMFIVLLFLFRKNRTYKILYIALTIGVFIPLFGYAFNLFNYSNNRWLFLLDFVACVCIALACENLKANANVVLKNKCLETIKKFFNQKGMLCALLVISISYKSISNISYSKEFDNGSAFSQLFSEQGHIISTFDNKEFFRTDKVHDGKYMNNYTNTPLNNHYQGTYSYNTLSNGNTYQFLKSLGMYNATNTLGLTGLNQRIAIQSLLSVKYSINNEQNVPYLYQSTEYNHIYENIHFLPLGIFYNQTISEKQYYSLSLLDRQASLMEYLVVSQTKQEQYYENTSVQQLEYEIVETKDVHYKNDDQYVTALSDDSYFKIKVSNSIINSEIYLNIYNYKATDKIQAISFFSEKAQYMQQVFPKGHMMYNNQKDFSYNFGYYENKENLEIIIRFHEKGKYNFNFQQLKLFSYSMNHFENCYEQLNSNSLKNVTFNEHVIKGTIETVEEGAIFFSIPYSKGWKAYVDNKPVRIYKAQIGFMAIDVQEGKHQIKLKYRTPFLKRGIALSSITLLFIIGYISYDLIYKKSKKHTKKH